MTEQLERIYESAAYIKAKSPFKEKISFALVTYNNPSFLREFKIHGKIKYSEIPPRFIAEKSAEGELLFASTKKGKKKFIILNGHINFYSGFKMRDAAHPIYVLNELGVKKMILVDEVGHLNPRFRVGEVALIYDQINLMGDNPLIGENENSIGPRFPDMSNPYDEKWYNDVEAFLVDKKYVYHPSVYLGVTGPETETEAECRFYREIGADVLGYSLVPENIALVHCGMSCQGFGIISRELVADRLEEISDSAKAKNCLKAEKSFAPLLAELISLIK